MRNYAGLFILVHLLFCASLARADIRSNLYAESLSFLSPDYTDISQKNFLFLGVKFKTEAKSTDAFRVDFTGTYAVGNSVLSSYNPRELAYVYELNENSNLTFGRKLHIWSALDTFWNYSLFQPVYEWNVLDPKNQGLTGFFYNYKSKSWALTLFASPLFIPDQGASYEIKDGQFATGNPFFQAPPQNIKFQGQVLPIDYNINRPKVEDVVAQTSYGAQFRYGEGLGFFAQTAAMSKPSNQLALGYKGILVTTRVRVDVTPEVYRENLFSADLGYRDQWGFVLLSAVYDQPQNPEFDASFNYPQFTASTIWGPQFLYKWEDFEFLLAYLDTSGGKITEVGPDVSAERNSLSDRFTYKQSVLTGISYTHIFWKQLRLDTSFQYKFSPREGYRLINFRNDFKLVGPWAFWVDLLLIDTNSSLDSGYEPNKNRDQIWLGVSYDL